MSLPGLVSGSVRSSGLVDIECSPIDVVLDANVVLAAEPAIKLNVEDELESGSNNEPVEWEGIMKLDDNVLDSVVVVSND